MIQKLENIHTHKRISQLRKIKYGYVKVTTTLDDLSCRVRDELLHKEKYKERGGFYGKEDWVSDINTKQLKNWDYHLTELRVLIRQQRKNKEK